MSTTRSPPSRASSRSRPSSRSCSSAARSCTRSCPATPQGRSNYRLAAIRPAQIGLDDDNVTAFVDRIAEESGEFLQIVNYNLRDSQYAIAGTVRGLEVLEEDITRRREEFGGKAAYILVPGIDVPFHSTVLRDGVPDFRDRLTELLPTTIDPAILAGRYVPNLVPKPFSLDRAFLQEIADLVPSEPLNAVLADFATWSAKPGELCRVVLIELLAWQFASPVRWIETQDLLFCRDGVSVSSASSRSVSVRPPRWPTSRRRRSSCRVASADPSRCSTSSATAPRSSRPTRRSSSRRTRTSLPRRPRA